jgi:hypothetical protein
LPRTKDSSETTAEGKAIATQRLIDTIVATLRTRYELAEDG